MMIFESLADIVVGVAEELQADLQDVTLAILDLLGVRETTEQLLGILRTRNSDHGNRRINLIRILGTLLPLKPVQRPYLRYVAMRSLSASSDSLLSSTTLGLADSRWALDDSYKEENTDILNRSSTLPNLLNRNFDSIENGGIYHYKEWGSSACSDNDKIAALEKELASLRQQVASILFRSSERPLTPPPTPVQSLPPPPPPCIPPPPPMPPTSSVNGKSSQIQPIKSFAELIAENKGNINKHNEPLEIKPNHSKQSNGAVSLSDVLKGLDTVKLKKIARSPGGTPLRMKGKTPPPIDAVSLIAAALKRRFAKIHMDSPEKDGLDTCSDFSSPDLTPRGSLKSRSSPKFLLKKVPEMNDRQHEDPSPPPFGQHLLKPRSSPSSGENNNIPQ